MLLIGNSATSFSECVDVSQHYRLFMISAKYYELIQIKTTLDEILTPRSLYFIVCYFKLVCLAAIIRYLFG